MSINKQWKIDIIDRLMSKQKGLKDKIDEELDNLRTMKREYNERRNSIQDLYKQHAKLEKKLETRNLKEIETRGKWIRDRIRIKTEKEIKTEEQKAEKENINFSQTREEAWEGKEKLKINIARSKSKKFF